MYQKLYSFLRFTQNVQIESSYVDVYENGCPRQIWCLYHFCHDNFVKGTGLG